MSGPILVGLAIGVVLTIHSPSLELWVVGGFVALAGAIVRPEVVLYALPVAVTLDATLVLAVGPLRAGPTDVLVGALAAGWIVRAGLAARDGRGPEGPTNGAGRERLNEAVNGAGRERLNEAANSTGRVRLFDRLRSRPFSGLSRPSERAVALLVAGLALYLGVILLSGVAALSRALVLKEALKWSEVLVVVLLGAAHLRQPGRQRIAAWVILAAATAEALLAYGQWAFAVGDLGATGASLRVFGTFGQPNPFAAYLNLALPLALALALLVRDARVRWPAVAVALLLLGAQALADSRGGLLGLGACVVVMLVVAVGIERPAAVVAVGGGALLALAWVTHILPTSLQQRALHLLRLDGVSLIGPLNDANFSAVERLAHWVAGWRMFLAHPLLGVGAGNYDPAYAKYHVPGWNLSLGHAHNYYINAAAETGIIGLVIFLALTAAMLYAPWRAARVAGSPAVVNDRPKAESDMPAVVNDRRTNAGVNAPETVHGEDRTPALQGRDGILG
ncbi:MAG TPA: O-antigen ligase family protein, partial [Ktedonobacterales bacterium]